MLTLMKVKLLLSQYRTFMLHYICLPHFDNIFQELMSFVDSKKELESSFEKANNFYFSPPLTRGLSKRLSIDPDGTTSISSRLSLEPDNLSRPSQRRLSQQGPEVEPPILLPTDNVTPRPPIHENQPIPRRMSLRGSRSQTPEVQEKPKVPRRGASEPPDNPAVAKVRKRGRKK